MTSFANAQAGGNLSAECADCGAEDATWASVNNGVLICSQCAGVHRSLGVEHSFVQSTTMDEWSPEKVKEFVSEGSQHVNETFLEFSVPGSYRKPNPHSSRTLRERFITAKYKHRLFIPWLGKNEREAAIIDTAEAAPSASRSIGEVLFVGVVAVKVVSASDLKNADFIGNAELDCSGMRTLYALVKICIGVAVVIKKLNMISIAHYLHVNCWRTHIVGCSDPYCLVRIGRQVFKTKTISNNLNPTWNETLMLSWDGESPLNLEVWDADNFSDDGERRRANARLAYVVVT
jgi:stromal membrane-associated protein